MRHDPPDYDLKWEYSEIMNEKLYICGEDELDELLYGEEESLNINIHGKFNDKPLPKIDVWIDLRDIRDSNRNVFIPSEIEYIPIPFADGNLEQAEEFLPMAKRILSDRISNDKRVLVSCHQGKSRSVLLVLWYLSELNKNFLEAYWDIKSKRVIMETDKNFNPIIDRLKTHYGHKN